MTGRTGSPIELDPVVLGPCLGTAPWRFTHHLTGEPLLSIDAIGAVADASPPASVEHHLADLPLLLPSGAAKRLPLSPREVATGIADNGCWMIVWNIHTRSDYQLLVERCLTEARVAAQREGGLTSPEASIIVSSPGAVVPIHLDRHHNLLLQIRGTKQVMIGRYRDPEVERRQIAQRFGEDAINATCLPDEQATFELGPGDGLYLPPYAFHSVIGGSEPSVSLACGFRTLRTERTEMVYECNAALRRLGLQPRPPGRSDTGDQLKVQAFRLDRQLRRRRKQLRQLLARWA